MTTLSIPFEKTGFFSPLITAYLENNKALASFYDFEVELDNFKTIIAQRNDYPVDRLLLHTVLNNQLQEYASSYPLVQLNIEALKNENCYTITTGHQLCIATGPLYFIYKIASAINLCKQLKNAFPDNHFVPVYWLASEDHDIEEINHINIFNKKITWETNQTGASGKVNTHDVQPFFNELITLAGNNEQAKKWITIFESHYNNQKTLAEATTSLVLSLFGAHGLVVINADDRDLKRSLSPIMQRDIFDEVSFKVMNSSIENLIATNLVPKDKVQVKPREINFFYLTNDYRKRIVFTNNKYQVLDTDLVFSKEELLLEIENNPEKFSPNVVIRPLYQEVILPNLAYIGGGGELSYWLEMKDLFKTYQVFFPALILRNSFLMMDEKQQDKFEKLGFETSEIFEPLDVLGKNYVQKNNTTPFDTIDESQLIASVFDNIKAKIAAIDKTLVATADAEKHKLLKSIEVLEQKVNKAQKNKFDLELGQIAKIKQQLFPEGGLQERVENILSLLIKNDEAIITAIISEANVFDKSFKIIIQ
jgi:bacillithiol biosynthesis cysteine-adding enzyme BshC